MEELPGAPVGTDRSRVALGCSKKQMPGQEDRTVGGHRNPGLVPELEIESWNNIKSKKYIMLNFVANHDI